MDCQGTQAEPEARPGGPGIGKRARGDPLALLSLTGPPGLPSGSSLGSLAIHHAIIILNSASFVVGTVARKGWVGRLSLIIAFYSLVWPFYSLL